jgi:hypothetical protein
VSEAVIDTSSLAAELGTWYGRRGYPRCGPRMRGVTNYDSTVHRKTLGPQG